MSRRKVLWGLILVLGILMIPQAGLSDGFWFGFGISNGYGYGSGYFGNSCGGYMPAMPVVPVVPYYGGGCTITCFPGPFFSYGPAYLYYYRHPYLYYRYSYYHHHQNWYDHPYYGSGTPRYYYYGGAYHPAPLHSHYGNNYFHQRTRIHVNQCNRCNLYR